MDIQAETKPINYSEFSWSYIYFPFIGLIILLLVLFDFNNHIKPVDLPYSSDWKLEDLRKTLNDYIPVAMHSAGVPGLSIAIIKNGKLNSGFNYGKTYSLSGDAINDSSVYEAASLSKPLTAWAVLKLISEKEIDLDSSFHEAGKNYTLRQLLSHSAGFDNQLGRETVLTKTQGDFLYSGQGYIKLGALITEISGMLFDDYMNQIILNDLGMDHSYFGEGNNESNQVKPHIAVTMPQAIGAILLVLSTLLLTVILWIGTRLLKRKIGGRHQQYVFLISCLISVALPLMFFGNNNGLRFAMVNIATIGFVFMVIKGFKTWQKHLQTSQRYAWAAIGLLSFVILAYSVWFRPPVPLKDRKSTFSPVAGLKTSAQDYAKFLIAIMNQDFVDNALVKEMTSSQVRVNDNNDWGLGLGIQNGKEKAVWHWGVNYPGFQALFVAWPERGDGIVILMNGGPMSLTVNKPRFAGLELARNIIIKTFGGQHFDYWQQVN